MKKTMLLSTLVISTLFSIQSFAKNATEVCSRTFPSKSYTFQSDDKNTKLLMLEKNQVSFAYDIQANSVQKASEMDRANAQHMLQTFHKNLHLTGGKTYLVKSIDDEQMGQYPRIGVFQVSDGTTAVVSFYRQQEIMLTSFCK